MPGRVLIETYGCQMNQAESEAMLVDLQQDGWRLTRAAHEADLVVINTCSVRETAEERVRGRLGWFRHEKRGRPFTLLLTGCMAERLKGRALEEFPEVDAVVGTFDKPGLREAARRATSGTAALLTEGREYRFQPQHSVGGPRVLLPIMHGCDNFCAYCVVPYLRGREVSRNPREVLDELAVLGSRGAREVTLLGQNVNSYRFEGPDGTIGFPCLLGLVTRHAGPVRWVRFLTSHPRDFSDELLDVMAAEPSLCRHVHLPVQSGSDRILALMNRGYTAERFKRMADRIRLRLPGASITTDLLVGFPGETEEDVRKTLRLMEEVGFDEAFTYRYNPREGTAAELLDGEVPEEEKLERLSRIIALQRSITDRCSRARLGRETEVLVEGISRRDPGELLARTEWDTMAVLPGVPSQVGSFIRVRLQSLSGATFRGQPL